MRTNTRVEFGLYDVTARGDSVPSSTDTRGRHRSHTTGWSVHWPNLR